MEDKGYHDSLGELFWKNAQEVWERNWMNLDLHTMLLDTKLLNATLLSMYNPMLMETILKKLREQFTSMASPHLHQSKHAINTRSSVDIFLNVISRILFALSRLDPNKARFLVQRS